MKKIVPFLLAFLLLLPMVVACKKDKPPVESKGETETLSPIEEIGLSPRDFGGKDFKILDANDHPELHVNYADTGEGTQVQQALFSRDVYIERANNIFLEYKQVNNVDNKALNSFMTSFDAGDRLYDMVVSTLSGGRLTTLACNGYLADLAKLPTLALDQKWWSSQMYEQMNLGGKMYFSTGDIMASVYDAPMVMYANKSLLAQYSIDDNLYEKVENGEWTVDYLATLVKNMDRDLNDDGAMTVNDDFFGLITQPLRLTAQGMLVGMDYVLSDVIDETIAVNVDSNLLAYADKIKSMVTNAQRTPGQSHDDVINVTFKNDRAIFLCHLIESATHNLADMASDYAILPMPKGSVEQEKYHSLVNGWVNCFIGVPYFQANGEYEETVGFMLEMMARASYAIVRPVAFEKVVMFQSVREPESLRMLNIIYDTLYLDFHCVYDFGGWGTEVANYIYRDKPLSSTIAGLTSKIEAAANEVADQWLNPRSSKE